jgi:hypothetical protein
MKLLRFTICYAALALLASAASSFKFTVSQPSIIAGSVIRPGDYRVVVNGDKATLTTGSISLEVPVKVETGTQKFSHTSVETRSEAGKNILNEVQIGGTTTTLVFTR